MKEATRNMKSDSLTSKDEYESDFYNASSAEAKICLNCDAAKCNGDCEKLRKERKKLKEARQ